MMKRILLSIFLAFSITIALAQAPDNYYSTAQDKYGEDLMEALHNIIKDHTVLSYTPGIWNAFYETDVRSDGKVWDMYSSCDFTFGNDQDSGSGGSAECQFYNREHSFPKSWFNDDSPMYTDLFHIYATDKKVNNVRSNYPYGEVDNASYTSSNGSKLGTSSISGYNGTVFEPTDEYKGDFARTYFYMATRYYDQMYSWSESNGMTNGTRHPAYNEWVVEMLLRWHENDPVSDKEINRNNAIFDNYQHNRNPFIDHPEFANWIWDEQASWVDTEANQSLNLYPNPASKTISITTTLKGEVNIVFFTTLGGEVKRVSKEVLGNKLDVSINDIPNGAYIVRVISGNVSETGQLIISR